MNTQPNVILLCTVGGSHEPIIKAIESTNPDYVCFLCTGPGEKTSNSSSKKMINGKGNVIKKHQEDEAPSLPNIPKQAKLSDSQFEIKIIPADDFDGALIKILDTLDDLIKRFGRVKFTADYTGGTKTMSAALVYAALERIELMDLTLTLVTGIRADLNLVQHYTEQMTIASIDRALLRRMLAQHLSAWRCFAYREAELGLCQVQPSVDSPDRTRLGLALTLSKAFARWDIFDHAGALELLRNYGARIQEAWPTLLRDLSLLVREGDKRQTPALIFDLWCNAERRAEQGRYDDAVARVYRMLEWTAQWQLDAKLGISTADFPRDKLPEDLRIEPAADGKLKIGLWHSWQVAALQLGYPMAGLVSGSEGDRMRGLLGTRNNSILAHGYKPVAKADWQQMCDWIKESFFPVFEQLAKEVGLKEKPDQLPRELPESV